MIVMSLSSLILRKLSSFKFKKITELFFVIRMDIFITINEGLDVQVSFKRLLTVTILLKYEMALDNFVITFMRLSS